MASACGGVEGQLAWQTRASRHEGLDRAFRQQAGPFVTTHDHAQPLAHEVVGDLREFSVGDRGGVAQQRLVDRIGEAALKSGVADREGEHVGGGRALQSYAPAS